mgnify:CR=1 FL=1
MTLSEFWQTATGGSLVTAGPFGTIDNTTLDGGNSSYHGYTTSAMPVGGTAILDGVPLPIMDPVAIHVPFAGSYNSALERERLPSCPATTRTLPSGSNVAV